MLEFEKKVTDFLRAVEFQFSQTGILLAVSGGADSIAVLYFFTALKSYDIFSGELYCAHINHHLRNDADSDEEFVISQAQKLKIPITTRHIDVSGFSRDNKLSIETTARQLRIEKLTEIAKENKCSRIVTGHQKNDNAETIIHRLLRGTGFRGLAGIRPIRKFDQTISFARPLLCVTREEIIKYLEQKNLTWQEDYTNKDYTYTRNHIRHRLIPALQANCSDSLIEQLSKLSLSANRFYKNICSQADNLWSKVAVCNVGKATLNLKIFSEQFTPIQLELIRRSLAEIGCGEADLTSRHYEIILNLAKQNTSRKKMQLPGGYFVQRKDENIVFTSRLGLGQPLSSRSRFIKGGVVLGTPNGESHPAILTIPGTTTFSGFTIQASVFELASPNHKWWGRTPPYKSTECFDFDKIKLPLSVRFRKEGDRFIPLGQITEKKIGKFMTAQHIPKEIRRRSIIIADIEKLIWLYPIRISEQTKVTSKTQRILQLQITEN